MTFLHDYLSVQFDPAHCLAELGFTVVFEATQLAAVALLWRRVIHPFICRKDEKKVSKRVTREERRNVTANWLDQV